MDNIRLECIEVNEMDGYAIINFQAFSDNPEIYATGNVYINVFDGSAFEVGKSYGLDLQEL